MPEIEIVWSIKAKKSYEDVIRFLESRWTFREINHFIDRTGAAIIKIKSNPYLYRSFEGAVNVRQVVLHPTVILFYELIPDESVVTLLLFWPTRKNPKDITF